MVWNWLQSLTKNSQYQIFAVFFYTAKPVFQIFAVFFWPFLMRKKCASFFRNNNNFSQQINIYILWKKFNIVLWLLSKVWVQGVPQTLPKTDAQKVATFGAPCLKFNTLENLETFGPQNLEHPCIINWNMKNRVAKMGCCF